MIQGRKLASNSLLNLGTNGVLLILGAIFVPLMIRSFGAELFGVLSVTWMVLGQLGWLDLGLSRASARYVAVDLSRDRPDEAAAWTWTALVTQLPTGLLGALVLWFAAPSLATALHVHPIHRPETILALRLFAVSIPLDLLSRPLVGVCQAGQRFLTINIINLIDTLWTFAAFGVGIVRSGNFRAVVIALLVWEVVSLVVWYLAAANVLPDLRLIPGKRFLLEYRERAREMFRFGGWVALSAVVGPLLLYFDQWIIGILLSAAILPFYTIPFNILVRLDFIPTSLTTTLFPAFSALHAEADLARIRLYLSSSARLLAAVLIPLFFVILVWGPDFLRIWIGPDFAMKGGVTLRILAAGVAVALLAPLLGALLDGIGRPDLVAKLYIVELPFNVASVWLLTLRFSLGGAAISYTARALIETCALWIIVWRVMPSSGKFRWRQLLIRTTIVLAPVGIALYFLSVARPSVGTAAGVTVLGLLVYGILAQRVLLHANERRALGGILRVGHQR